MKIENIKNALAATSFVFLYPITWCDYFLKYAYDVKMLPLWGIIKYLPCVFLLACLFSQPKKEEKWGRLGFILFILSYILIIVLFGNNYGRSRDGSNVNLLFFNLFVLFGYIGNYITGYFFEDNNKIYVFLLTCWLVMCGMTVGLWNKLGDLKILTEFLNLDMGEAHLLLGDILAVVAILIISLSKNINIKMLVYGISLVLLIILGSRSALYIFVITEIIVHVRRLFCGIAGNNGVMAAVTIILPMLLFINNNLMTEKMFRLFLSSQIDGSFFSRKYLLADGIEAIKRNWFIGDYLGQVRGTGSVGTYIHNYLSFYRQYGLIPFSALFTILLINIKKIIKNDIIFGVAVFCLISISVARSYTFYPIWFVLGNIQNRD